MTRIFGYGLLTWDHFLSLSHFPGPDEKTRATGLVEAPGGPVPAALGFCARSGLNAVLAARIGDDLWGKALAERLTAEGLDCRYLIREAEMPTARATILTETRHGRRSVILSPEPPSGHPLQALPESFADEMQPGDYLLLDARDGDTSRRLAAAARERGVRIMVDPGARTLDLCYWESLIDILIVSKDFILRNYGEIDLFTAVRNLAAGKISLAAITLGPGGLLWSTGENSDFIPARKVETIDSTGAGDILHGACLYALAKNQGYRESLEFAAAAAAWSTCFTGVFSPEITADGVCQHFGLKTF